MQPTFFEAIDKKFVETLKIFNDLKFRLAMKIPGIPPKLDTGIEETAKVLNAMEKGLGESYKTSPVPKEVIDKLQEVKIKLAGFKKALYEINKQSLPIKSAGLAPSLGALINSAKDFRNSWKVTVDKTLAANKKAQKEKQEQLTKTLTETQ